jgi:hypothetical protein
MVLSRAAAINLLESLARSRVEKIRTLVDPVGRHFLSHGGIAGLYRCMKLRAIIFGATMIGGCLDPGDEVADTSSTAQPSIIQIGWIPQNGTTVAFDDITSSNLNLNSVTDITACDATALYATIGTNLYFSNNSGQSWTYEGVVHGPRIACDHAQLANLDASGQLWMSPLWANGNLAHDPTTQVLQWVSSPGLSMTRIQGGDGTFYGTRPSGAGYDVYVASNLSWQVKPVWSSLPIAHIGAIQVTGTGATHTGSDNAADRSRGRGWRSPSKRAERSIRTACCFRATTAGGR